MNIEKLYIYDLFQRERRYTVPQFQRTYSWNQIDQWEPLWEDIAGVALERDKSNHSTPDLTRDIWNQNRVFTKRGRSSIL